MRLITLHTNLVVWTAVLKQRVGVRWDRSMTGRRRRWWRRRSCLFVAACTTTVVGVVYHQVVSLTVGLIGVVVMVHSLLLLLLLVLLLLLMVLLVHGGRLVLVLIGHRDCCVRMLRVIPVQLFALLEVAIVFALMCELGFSYFNYCMVISNCCVHSKWVLRTVCFARDINWNCN